jgi:uncharacterized damage-inducible protein DinB
MVEDEMTPKLTTSPALSASEIEEGRAYLQRARDRALSATTGLSEEQWAYGRAADGWSVAGILEHMVIVQDLVLGPIADALDGTPETPGADSDTIDSIVKTQFQDRSRKFPAPERARPCGRWTPVEALERLSANTERLIERLGTTHGLRLHRVPAAPLKAISNGHYELMDGYQWLLAAAAHTERHVDQILEWKAQPGFPAR